MLHSLVLELLFEDFWHLPASMELRSKREGGSKNKCYKNRINYSEPDGGWRGRGWREGRSEGEDPYVTRAFHLAGVQLQVQRWNVATGAAANKRWQKEKQGPAKVEAAYSDGRSDSLQRRVHERVSSSNTRLLMVTCTTALSKFLFVPTFPFTCNSNIVRVRACAWRPAGTHVHNRNGRNGCALCYDASDFSIGPNG